MKTTGDLSCARVFDTLIPARLRANVAEAEAIGAVIQFELEGDGGGQWTVDLAVEGGRITRGREKKADVTVKMTAQDFLAMARGSKAGGPAWFRRRIHVSGDVTLALWLEQLLTGGVDDGMR